MPTNKQLLLWVINAIIDYGLKVTESGGQPKNVTRFEYLPEEVRTKVDAVLSRMVSPEDLDFLEKARHGTVIVPNPDFKFPISASPEDGKVRLVRTLATMTSKPPPFNPERDLPGSIKPIEDKFTTHNGMGLLRGPHQGDDGP